MEVSAEKLAEVDEQLEQLGRSEDQIHSVLARFDNREARSLEAIDAELAELEADVLGLTAQSRPPPSSDVPVPPEPSEADSPPVGGGPSLDAADLFGEEPSQAEVEAQAEADFAALFEGGSREEPEDSAAEAGLADSLEGDVVTSQPSARSAPDRVEEEDPEDFTNVFSAQDIEAIREHASEPPPPPASASTPAPSAKAASERPSQRPSQRPRDPDLDALLGDDEAVFRPSSPPPPGATQAALEDASSGDFELLVDEDVMLIDEDEDEDFPEELPTRAEAGPFVPGEGEPTSAESGPPATGDEVEEGDPGEKKGFFKKLFGNE